MATTSQLLPNGWDGLAGDHFYSSAAWLRLCDSWPGRSITPVTRHAGGRLRSAVPTARHDDAAPSFYQWNTLLETYGLPQLQPTGVVVGPDQGYQSHFLVADGEDAVAEIAGLVDVLRAEQGDPAERACVAMYLTTAGVRGAQSAGVRTPPVLLEPDAWFDVPPGGWDGWLATLTSKRRVSIRREVAMFTEAGYQIEHLPLSQCYEQLAALAASTQGKYGHATQPDQFRGSFERQVKVMGDRAQVSLCLLDGRPVGFCLYYLHHAQLYLRWAGFIYDELQGAAEYFNLVYYDHFRRSERTGIRRIHAGIKAVEAKALRGARLQPLWLLDLSEVSPLQREAGAVRGHNARVLARLGADRRTAAALGDLADWHVST